MALVAKNEFKAELAPEGTQLAVCVWVIDLGWQHNPVWNKDQHKVLIAWELPDCIMPDSDKPFMISRQFTLTMDERGDLRPLLESWRGKSFTEAEVEEGFDIRKLLGQWGNVSITHSEDGKYANVKAIVGLSVNDKKAILKRKILNPFVSLDLDAFDQKTFESVPRWVQEKIMKSQEWRRMNGEIDPFEPTDEDMEDIDEDSFNRGGPNDPDDLPF